MQEGWWNNYPWRMVQTNFREIDMSDVNAEEYVRLLLEFNATVVLLNTSGIIASYDTNLKFHTKSKFLKGDRLQEIINLCKENKIRVIARTDFSKVRQEVYESHPEWAYRTREGKIINYNGDVHACINGGYQQEYAFKIIEETIDKLKPDGIFCNMGGFQVKDYSYNYYGICHCDRCKELFWNKYKRNLPVQEDFKDENYRKYLAFKDECVRNYRKRLYDFTKSIDSNIAVAGEDFERCESNTEYKRALPYWQYSASSNTRAIRGVRNDKVASNTSVDFIGYFYRHVAVSAPLQKLRLWQDLTNLGGLDYYIMGRLDHHEDKSGFEAVKEVFQYHKNNEKFYLGLQSKAHILLLRSSLRGNSSEERGYIRALTESHYIFDEDVAANIKDTDISKYSLVIVPNIQVLSSELVEKLDQFVKNGGKLIVTGEAGFYNEEYDKRCSVPFKCLGIKRVNYCRDDMASAMFKIKDEEKELFKSYQSNTLVAFGDKYIFADYSGETHKYMVMIPPQRIGPPERCYSDNETELPAVTKYSYGRGIGIYVPALIGALYYEEGYDNSLYFIRDTISQIGNENPIETNLTPMVEIGISSHGDSDLVIQLVNNTGHYGTSFFKPVSLYNITIKVSCIRQPHKVYSVKTNAVIPYSYNNNNITINLLRLDEYDCICVDML